MKKAIFMLATTALMGALLAGCGSEEETSSKESSEISSAISSTETKKERSKTIGSYISSEIVSPASYGAGSFNALTYQVNFFENNVYEYISTELNYGYSMVLGTTSTIVYGTYSKGSTEDGVTEYSLNVGKEVLFNSYSLAGGYNISINTMNQTYPVEMLAHTQGEKLMATSKEDVIKEYGKGQMIYANEGKNTFGFVNPNADTQEKKEVTTPSGEVSSLLISNVKKCHVVSDFVSPASYGDGSWNADIYQVNTFEDGNYEFVKTEINYGYSMNLGTTTINNYGKIAYGTSEDGYTPATLAAADKVVFNSYSLAGGYNISINTDNQTYPVEMLAHTQGEKLMAHSKEDVVNEYGSARTYYLSDTNNLLSLTNPNA